MHMKFSESELPPPFMDNEQVFLPRRLAKRIAKAINNAIERNYVKKMLVDKGGRPNLVELLVFHPDYAGNNPKLSTLDDEEKAWLIGIADFFDKSNGCYISRFDLHIVK